MVGKADLLDLSTAWQDANTPGLQDVVSSYQIQEFKQGRIDPVFEKYIDAVEFVSKEAKTLLDLACGGGYYSYVIGQTAPNLAYQGADFSAAMVEKAAQNFPGKSFEVQNATATSYEDDSFDVVSLSGALEHIPEYEKAIAELCRVASLFVILHRVPLAEGEEIKHTKTGQYNIVTPRIYFPLLYIEAQFASRGFDVAWKAPTYDGREDTVTFVLRAV